MKVSSPADEGNLATLIARVLAPYTADRDAVVMEPGAAVGLPSRAIMSLKQHDVPFALASAYDKPERIGGAVLAGAPNVGKPAAERRLLAALDHLTG